MFNAVASSLSPSLVTSAQTCVTLLALSPWDFKSDVCKNPCPYPQTLSQRSSILVYRCSFKKRSTQLVQGKSVVQSIAIASAQVPKLNLLPLCESAVTSLWINAAPVLISYSVMCLHPHLCPNFKAWCYGLKLGTMHTFLLLLSQLVFLDTWFHGNS